MKQNKKGMVNVIGAVVVLIVALVLGIGVLVPVTQTVITNQSFTGTNATVANSIITFILIGMLVLVAVGLILATIMRKE